MINSRDLLDQDLRNLNIDSGAQFQAKKRVFDVIYGRGKQLVHEEKYVKTLYDNDEWVLGRGERLTDEELDRCFRERMKDTDFLVSKGARHYEELGEDEQKRRTFLDNQNGPQNVNMIDVGYKPAEGKEGTSPQPKQIQSMYGNQKEDFSGQEANANVAFRKIDTFGESSGVVPVEVQNIQQNEIFDADDDFDGLDDF